MTRDYMPCGACGQYVSREEGCIHIRPKAQASHKAKGHKPQSEGRRARNTFYKQKARAKQFDLWPVDGMIVQRMK